MNESLMLIPDTIARAACAAERERCVSQLVALANQMHAEAQGHTWVDPETAQGNDLAAMCVQFAMERAIIALREVRGFANQARATRIHRARSVQPAENERLREALHAVEWTKPPYPVVAVAFCPWCGTTEADGHRLDCMRQAALEPPQQRAAEGGES